MRSTVRYSIAPIWARVGAKVDRDVAKATGCCVRTVQRWKQTGLSERSADRAAIAAQEHDAQAGLRPEEPF